MDHRGPPESGRSQRAVHKGWDLARVETALDPLEPADSEGISGLYGQSVSVRSRRESVTPRRSGRSVQVPPDCQRDGALLPAGVQHGEEHSLAVAPPE